MKGDIYIIKQGSRVVAESTTKSGGLTTSLFRLDRPMTFVSDELVKWSDATVKMHFIRGTIQYFINRDDVIEFKLDF